VILLDTHVLLWWQADGHRLSTAARPAIDSADSILVSPISCWEVGLLASKGRIELDRDAMVWVQDFLETDRVALAELTATAAVAASRLASDGFPGDPADGFLYATARERDVPLVTKDPRLRGHARERRDLRVIW
jgi:PIN domain nuclease of toxin-antitoxin system